MSEEVPSLLYRQSLRTGAMYIIASAALFSCVGSLVKTLTQDLPVPMVVFFRSAIGLAWLAPWLWNRRGFTLRTRRWKDHAVRGVSGILAMALFFFALSRLPLAQAVLLNFTAPLFIPLIARCWLGEKLSAKIFVALGVGFVGVAFVVRPAGFDIEPAMVAGLVSAVFAAIALVGIRNLTNNEPAARVVFYFGVVSTLISLPVAVWVWVAPTPEQWMMAIAMAGLATLAQLLLTRGYASAPAGQVGYYQYSSVLFSALIGWMVWSEVPTPWAGVGALLILVAGVVASGYNLVGSGTALLELMTRSRDRETRGAD
ncbi:MAG TPA: DMT family transporter [Kiritimatiellia bacterium]|nr:DMT family transporter [Kiritimatiellia bacterium]